MPPPGVADAISGSPLIITDTCTTNGLSWSVIAAAPTNSNLAAFLAGFMVTAIAVMFVERSGETPRHTLGLFASGVLVLGLDSYLFSSIAARRPPMTDSHLTMLDSRVDVEAGGLAVCRGVWAQAMPAFGMLAVGSVALVGGLSWMLVHYAAQSGWSKPNWFLPLLGGLLTFAATTSTTALTAQVAIDYINITRMSPHDLTIPTTPLWAMWLMWTVFTASTVVALLLVVVRTVGMIGALVAEPATDETLSHTRHRGEARLRLIPLASIAAALLALTGPIFAGILIHRGIEVESPYVMATALTLGVFVPVAISLAVCYSVPGYGWTEFTEAVRTWRVRRTGT